MEIQKNKVFFKLLFILVDMALINAGYLLAFLCKFGWDIPEHNFVAYLNTWPWFTLSAFALLYFYGLYGSYRWRWAEVFASLICALFFQALAAMALSFLFRGFAFPRTVLLAAPLIQLVLLGFWRRMAWRLERKLQTTRKVVVVGRPQEAVALADKLESATGGIIKVSGLVFDSRHEKAGRGNQESASTGCTAGDTGTNAALGVPDNNRPVNISGKWPVLGSVVEFDRCLDATVIDQVFVCSNIPQECKADVVCACVAKDKKVFLIPEFYEVMLAQARLEQVDDMPVFAVGRLAIPDESLIIKRATDILLSLVALAVTAPLGILVSVAVKLDSPGPVFYRQKRLTLQGKPFYLYKFRTMVDKAEKESGPVLAQENDPRITRVGRILRAARIDEIPQLLNVLKGDMSIVGPRPERPFFVSKLVKESPEYAYRMNVKSGITGLAQIAGRYSTSPENKLIYDLIYTKSYSPARDLAILLQTIKVILMKDKAS